MNLQDLIVTLAGKVGLYPAADGSQMLFRLSKTGALITSPGHGKYTEAALRRKLFFNYAPAVAMSAPATAAIGNIVWNPPDSGVNLALVNISLHMMADDADMSSINLCYSAQATLPTTTSGSTCGCTFLGAVGAGGGLAKGYGIATITTAATPIYSISKGSVAKLTLGMETHIFDVNGMFICPPGYLFSLHSIAAAAATGVTSTMIWEEIPIT